MDSSAFLAFGAIKHNLGSIDSAFGFDYAAGLALSAGFDVFGNDVSAFNNALAFFGRNAKHFAYMKILSLAPEVV